MKPTQREAVYQAVELYGTQSNLGELQRLAEYYYGGAISYQYVGMIRRHIRWQRGLNMKTSRCNTSTGQPTRDLRTPLQTGNTLDRGTIKELRKTVKKLSKILETDFA